MAVTRRPGSERSLAFFTHQQSAVSDSSFSEQRLTANCAKLQKESGQRISLKKMKVVRLIRNGSSSS
jgi:hypothetical protein